MTQHIDDQTLLHNHIKTVFDSELVLEHVSDIDLNLLLLKPPKEVSYDLAQIEAIWSNMPYWAFVWSSGRALAKYVLANPHLVKGKTIADFGAGSGVVALAALKAGAKHAWAVDIDDTALLACRENAKHNGVYLDTALSLEATEGVDLILVGDILYDPRNHNLAASLFTDDNRVIWAESKAQTKLSQYGPVAQLSSETHPNIGGFDEHTQIHIYHHGI